MGMLTVTGIVLCAVCGSAPQQINTFDLTYTLKLNPADPVQARAIWDQTHAVSALQGIVNRDVPRLYLYFVGGDNAAIDHYWMKRLQEPGEWLEKTELKPLPDLKSVWAAFKNDIQGLVVYDENVASTSNVASTVAGVENLIPVRYDTAPESLYTFLTTAEDGPKWAAKVWLVNPDGTPKFIGKGTIPDADIPSTGSPKCDAYMWANARYLDSGKCNPVKMGYYLDAYWLKKSGGAIPNHTLSNHDYVIAKRGFLFDLAPWEDEIPVDEPAQPMGADATALKAILRSAWERTKGKEMVHVAGFVPWDKKYTDFVGGKHEAVPTEWRYAQILSCFNAYMDADALGLSAMANASVFMHYPLKDEYPQSKPTLDDLKKRGFVSDKGEVAKKSFVTIYVGDYDAAAWLYQRIPDIWDDPERGQIPLGWAFNPTLAERFAPGMAYARRTKTDNDFFMAGDSGAGYINPGHLQEPREFSGLPSGIDTWKRHCKKYYKQWDLSITGFIIDGFAPAMNDETKNAYRAFSRDGIVAQKIDPAGMFKDMPFVRMNYDLNGNPEECAKTVVSRIRAGKPQFLIFRTILWSPGGHKKLFEAVKASEKGPEVEIVDPYTFFLLVKQQHGGK